MEGVKSEGETSFLLPGLEPLEVEIAVSDPVSKKGGMSEYVIYTIAVS